MDCGDCTTCCVLPPLPELGKPANVVCVNCTSDSCSIYEFRPAPCKEFSCAYHQMAKASVKLRPDNCGVMFEKLENDLMFGSVDPKHKDFSFVNGQIKYFLSEGINVVTIKSGIPTVYHVDGTNPETLLARVYAIARRV